MRTEFTLSIIITTYNWPEALLAVLLALNHQQQAFEVLIADDGSKPETKNSLDSIAAQLHYPWKHIWHEDQGFRAAKIRNKAVAAAKGDYILFLDGDCIPSASLVRRHRALAEPGWWVAGNRVLLSESFAKTALANQEALDQKSFLYWCKHRLTGDCNRLLPLLFIPQVLMAKRKWQPSSWEGAKTCNLAVWKKDFLAVNGFDEAYEGWGYEDSDLVIRLIRKGIYRKSGRFALPVFHLGHPENTSSRSAENLERLQHLIKNEDRKVILGVNQYV